MRENFQTFVNKNDKNNNNFEEILILSLFTKSLETIGITHKKDLKYLL